MHHASTDFAAGRMTHPSLGASASNRFNGRWRRWVSFLGTTGLPVGLHGGFPKEDGFDMEKSRGAVDDQRGHHPQFNSRGLDGFDENKFCLFAGARVDVLNTFWLQRLLSQSHQEINRP